jgi:hypothetical protein
MGGRDGENEEEDLERGVGREEEPREEDCNDRESSGMGSVEGKGGAERLGAIESAGFGTDAVR